MTDNSIEGDSEIHDKDALIGMLLCSYLDSYYYIQPEPQISGRDLNFKGMAFSKIGRRSKALRLYTGLPPLKVCL